MASAKMKTHKGCKKRFKLSARGKVRYKQSFAGHLMSSKSGNRCRRMRHPAMLSGLTAKRVETKLLPGA